MTGGQAGNTRVLVLMGKESGDCCESPETSLVHRKHCHSVLIHKQVNLLYLPSQGLPLLQPLNNTMDSVCFARWCGRLIITAKTMSKEKGVLRIN